MPLTTPAFPDQQRKLMKMKKIALLLLALMLLSSCANTADKPTDVNSGADVTASQDASAAGNDNSPGTSNTTGTDNTSETNNTPGTGGTDQASGEPGQSPAGFLPFFDPVMTPVELHEVETGFAYSSIQREYDIHPAEVNKRITAVMDMLWLNGRLLVAADNSGILVFNADLQYERAIVQLPNTWDIYAYSLTSDADGKLYALINRTWLPRGTITFTIAVFGSDLEFERSIDVVLEGEQNDIFPGSLAINPDGGFYLVLGAASTTESDGCIYYISDSGEVSKGPGNKSFGYLLAMTDSLYFANGSFPYEYDSESDSYFAPFGLSAVYKVQGGAAVGFTLLPQEFHIPMSEAETEAVRQIYIDTNGEDVPPDTMNQLKQQGWPCSALQGYADLFALEGEIAVLGEENVIHIFDEGLNYRYSFSFRDIVKEYKDSVDNWSSHPPIAVAACADGDGNIYVAQSTYQERELMYGILKASPRD